MGIDARMFVRIKGKENWLKPEDELKTAVELAVTIGHGNFLIGTDSKTGKLSYGSHALSIIQPYGKDEWEKDPELVGKVVYRQDADPIIADEDEQFISIHLMSRYYSPGYARGDWPTLFFVAMWCARKFPKGEVWYGGDSSGVEAVPFNSISDEYTKFYLDSGRSTYTGSFSSIFSRGETTPVCPACEINLISNGGGGGKTFWSCLGCGQHVITEGRKVYRAGKWVNHFKMSEQIKNGDLEPSEEHA